MINRPDLEIHLEESTFRNFYYLKEELVLFCKKMIYLLLEVKRN